jgi:hypothetical protein
MITAGTCVSALTLSLSALDSEKSVYADPQTIEQAFDETDNMPPLFAQADDENKRLERDKHPASRPRPDFEWGRDQDKKPREKFPERFSPGKGHKRGMRPHGNEKGFGRGRGRDKEPGPYGEFMTPTEIEELMEFAKEHFPEIYQRLNSARETDPRSFRYMIKRVGGPIYRLYRLYKHNPELAKIMIAEHKTQMEIFALQRDYRQATSETEKASIKTALHAELVKRFGFRQQRTKLEIESLRKRLEEQAKRLEESEKNKEKMINEELQRTIDRMEGKSFF